VHGASRHWGLILLLLLGVAVRGVVVYAYVPAFFFPDSVSYLDVARTGEAQVHRPWGYSAFLAAFGDVPSLRAVVAVQHGLGLLSAVLVYALLQRRGLGRLLSCLAAAPLALDGYLVQVEHYVMAESLYITLLVGALVLLLWHERPPWWAGAGSGVLFGLAAVTRTVGTVVLGLVAVYLLVQLIRRTFRLWSAGMAAVGVVAVLVPYVLWFQSATGTYALTDYTGHFLYGRVSTFADCDEVDVPTRLRGLCPTQPVETRRPSDWYVWDPASPANRGRYSEEDLQEFSTLVLRGQAMDFVGSTASKTLKYFLPGRSPGRLESCAGWWEFPAAAAGADADVPGGCPAVVSPPWGGFEPQPSLVRADAAAVLVEYQNWVHTPGPVQGVLAVIGLSGLVRIRRRGATRDALDGVLCVLIGLAVIAVPSATSVFDYRYGLPLLAVLPLGAALAWRSLRPAEPGLPSGDEDLVDPVAAPTEPGAAPRNLGTAAGEPVGPTA
jgi:hypothetical protein